MMMHLGLLAVFSLLLGQSNLVCYQLLNFWILHQILGIYVPQIYLLVRMPLITKQSSYDAFLHLWSEPLKHLLPLVVRTSLHGLGLLVLCLHDEASNVHMTASLPKLLSGCTV